jgi:hypothetical protein
MLSEKVSMEEEEQNIHVILLSLFMLFALVEKKVQMFISLNKTFFFLKKSIIIIFGLFYWQNKKCFFRICLEYIFYISLMSIE